MSYTKPVPPVSDYRFDIQTPAFIVVYGYVVHVMAVQYNKEQIMSVGDSVSYKRHGRFQVCCIHEGHAVIQHTTLSGKVMNMLVPDKQWLNVSNGTYKAHSPHYDSFLIWYKRLEKVPVAEQIRISYSTELFDKYHSLFDAFNGYWKENFAESVQEDKDPHTFGLGARIRYGMFCVMEGQPIPDNCGYEKLVTEVDSWVDYREGKYN
jgi:hypothetical protein